MKRLRKYLEPVKVRFFACGEYGDNTYRPHYHLILFGCDFRSDRRLYKLSNAGFPIILAILLISYGLMVIVLSLTLHLTPAPMLLAM